MRPAQRVMIDELVVEVGHGTSTRDIVRQLARVLAASGVERADDVAGAIVDDLGRRQSLGDRP